MKSKIIAVAIFLLIFLFPFRMLFFTDELVQGQKFILLLLANVFGFFIAFAIGTNEPYDKKKENKPASSDTNASEMRKAA